MSERISLKKVLMQKDKETVINLYLSAKPKADAYDRLLEELRIMVAHIE